MPKVIRFALSDLSGAGQTTASVDAKAEAGYYGLIAKNCQSVGGVCTDYSGNIYVADTEQHAIFRIDEGGRISLFAGLPGTSGRNTGRLNVEALAARFNTPRGLACDKSNNIYVCDSGNNQIRVINSGRVSIVAGDDDGVAGFVDSVGGAAMFNAPYDVAVDHSGVLYVTDYSNHAIRQIKDGTVLTTVGNLPAYGGPTAGNALNVAANNHTASLTNPTGIAVDASGDLFICDSGNRIIKKIIPKGFIYRHSGGGNRGYSLGTAGSQATTCEYDTLNFMSVDARGNLFVVDLNTTDEWTRLVKVDPSGVPSVVVNMSGTSYNDFTIGAAMSPGQKLFVTLAPTSEAESSSSSSSLDSSSSSSTSSSSTSSSSSSSSSNP